MARKFMNNFWILDFHASLTIEKVLRPQSHSITNSNMSQLVVLAAWSTCCTMIPRGLFSYSSLYSSWFSEIVYVKSLDISS